MSITSTEMMILRGVVERYGEILTKRDQAREHLERAKAAADEWPLPQATAIKEAIDQALALLQPEPFPFPEQGVKAEAMSFIANARAMVEHYHDLGRGGDKAKAAEWEEALRAATDQAKRLGWLQ